jgi:predicted nucleic acid-binding Zn ribbon protein
MKTCLECNEKIVGREDKKFCSDGCRNAYNNKINKDSNNFMRNVNNKLRKNYRILSETNTEGKTKTTRSKLLTKGFDFDYFTSILNTKTGNSYRFVYDQGYLILDNDYFMLVKKEI